MEGVWCVCGGCVWRGSDLEQRVHEAAHLVGEERPVVRLHHLGGHDLRNGKRRKEGWLRVRF